MPIQTVDPATLKDWLDRGEAILIDVREPEEHQKENIPGAISLPLAKISYRTLPELESKRLVVHCALGKRGALACEKLLDENPELDIYNLDGGITAWLQHGNKVNRNESEYS